MKKVISCIILIFIIMFLTFTADKTNETQSINKKLLRFHVIANSDSYEDQSVKLKVRDAILKNIGPQLEKCSNLDESLKVIEANKDKIEEISNDILKKEGKDYNAKAMLGEFQFPVKTYGSITLPAGEYTALRVVLGNGDGKNWWCVMFPPLCFIDITRGVTSKETDEELKRVLGEDEVKSITAFKQIDGKVNSVSNTLNKNDVKTKSKHSPNVEFKFKSVEIFDKLKDIIKNNL
ncbi:stage II sporulation protein R [Caloramator quimbayensis]|uniref:Stage II sporulation protein R n=1 Tax=Caloramator quimbayensis TaxID=1147123 RepID=A0A1T4WGB4_9CLOT|nr:stage II sporulation protein R [Caloramator quimbayensis]SKA76247.1 stage II sporulation protein R [Caloramator quimbayensis]